jgi:hypothetical protein
MPTIILNADIEKTYESWVQNFDSHQTARKSAGIEALYRGHVIDDPKKVFIVLSTPSMEVMDNFMKQNADHIKNSGHILESTKITVCSD